MVNNTTEIQSAVAVLRTLLRSSQSKNGILIDQLLNDYQKFEGALPLKKFGFDTLEAFIKSTKEFDLNRSKDGIRVTARSSTDATRTKRTTDQSQTIRKNKVNVGLEPRRPVRPQSMNGVGQTRNSSAFSDIYSRLPSRSTKKAAAATLAHTTQPTKRTVRESHTSSNAKNGNGERIVRNDDQGASKVIRRVIINTGGTERSQPRIVLYQPPKPAVSRAFTSVQSTGNGHSGSATSEIPASTKLSSTHKSSLNNRLTRLQNMDQEDNEPKRGANKESAAITSDSNEALANNRTLNNRLTRLQSDEDTVDFVRPVIASNRRASTEANNNEIKSSGADNPVRALIALCKRKHYGMPRFEFYQLKGTHRIGGRVHVNNCIIGTYPEDFATEQEAKLNTAKVALAQLTQSDEEGEAPAPLCMDNDTEIAIKVLDCIKASEYGVFKKNIPHLFRESFDQALPDYWFNILVENPLMFNIEKGLNDDIIYWSGNDASSPPITPTADDGDKDITAGTTIDNKVKPVQPNELVLPWKDQHWNLYITHPKSTVEVWARIIGAEYSTEMDSIITDIELSLLTDKKQAGNIIVGDIYLVSLTECWYRVRADRYDHVNQRCHCFFIDVGDEDWFPLDEIYVCDPKFQRFPAQAICFSLVGLEDFAGNPQAAQHIDEMLANKVLIGEVLTKADEYTKQNQSTDLQAKIQIELYDTSSQEDVRLNPLILNKICESTVEPTLDRDRRKMNLVYVSHVADNGDIFCHLQNSANSLHYINKVIHQLTATGSTCEKFRAAAINENRGTIQGLYLVFDKVENRWYRASIVNNKSEKRAPQTDLFKSVDYGFELTIEMENIYQLEMLSAALNKYPPQAIVMRLYEVHTFDDSIIGRLRGLLLPNGFTPNASMPSHASTIVMVVEGTTIPVVNIYKRTNPHNILYRVNDTIRMELELENCTDIAFDSFDSNIGNTQPISNNNNNTLTESKSPVLIAYPPPEKEQFFNVFVTLASNPLNFVMRPLDAETEFRELMTNLQRYCKENNVIPTEDDLKPGNCLAALNQDKVWYRVILEQRLSTTMVVVNCDYGEIFVVEWEKLRILPEKFRKLPQLAMRAKLHGIQPKNKDWIPNDCTRFQDLTVGKCFAAKTINFEPDDQKYTLEVLLVDVSTNEDIFMHKLLINEGRAIPK